MVTIVTYELARLGADLGLEERSGMDAA